MSVVTDRTRPGYRAEGVTWQHAVMRLLMAAATVFVVVCIALWLALSAWVVCFLPFDVPGVHC